MMSTIPFLFQTLNLNHRTVNSTISMTAAMIMMRGNRNRTILMIPFPFQILNLNCRTVNSAVSMTAAMIMMRGNRNHKSLRANFLSAMVKKFMQFYSFNCVSYYMTVESASLAVGQVRGQKRKRSHHHKLSASRAKKQRLTEGVKFKYYIYIYMCITLYY